MIQAVALFFTAIGLILGASLGSIFGAIVGTFVGIFVGGMVGVSADRRNIYFLSGLAAIVIIIWASNPGFNFKTVDTEAERKREQIIESWLCHDRAVQKAEEKHWP